MKGSNPVAVGVKRKTRRSAYKTKSSEQNMQNPDSDEFSQNDDVERRATRKQHQNKRK
jgi:hypothetical protein